MSLNKSAMLYLDPAALDPNPLTAKTSQECVDALVAVREAMVAHPDLARPDVMAEVAGMAQKLGGQSLTQAQGEQALERLRELFPNVLTSDVAAFATSAGSDVSWAAGETGLKEDKALGEAITARGDVLGLAGVLALKDAASMVSPPVGGFVPFDGGSPHLPPEHAAPLPHECCVPKECVFLTPSLPIEALEYLKTLKNPGEFE